MDGGTQSSEIDEQPNPGDCGMGVRSREGRTEYLCVRVFKFFCGCYEYFRKGRGQRGWLKKVEATGDPLLYELQVVSACLAKNSMFARSQSEFCEEALVCYELDLTRRRRAVYREHAFTFTREHCR